MWVNKDILHNELNLIKNTLNFLWIENFIWFLDEYWKEYSVKQIVDIIIDKIKESDLVLCFINHTGVSEGMFFELGVSYTLNKKIIIFINKKIKDQYWLINWLTNNIMYFDDLDDFADKLNNFFNS